MGQPAVGEPSARTPLTHRRRAWPFKVQKPAQTGVTEFGVGVPPRQEVEFEDGSRIWLLRVELQAGLPDLFLRDLGAPAAGVRVDLRRLVPELANELPSSSTRDVPGMVHFSLRGRFKSVQQLLDEAVSLGRPA